MSKRANVCLTLVTSLAFALPVSAGSLLSSTNRYSVKGCDDYGAYQPDCCRPQIVRPTSFRPAHRKTGCGKPEACYQAGCDLDSCCPVTVACVPAEPACAPASFPCVETASPLACDDSCCSTGCSELAELIQRSQTACHSWDRRDAVHKLSDRYKCCEHPAVMNALVYALNDPDERVRSKAADEIGDQLRVSPNCCTPTVLNALKHALSDCDRFVRRQAEEALRAAGYDVVDGCCTSRNGTCDPCCVASTTPMAVPTSQATATKTAAAPATHRTSVTVNDATPTTPAAAPVPPPKDEIVPPGPSGLTPVVFESTSPLNDAPIPARPGASGGAAAANHNPTTPAPSPRRPLRQTLNNLFNQH